jgi:carboxymethylenebutenolidase
MGEYTTLMARDGHEFQAYLSAPNGAARGAILVLQEIFGVNAHMRAVTDQFAAAGYVAIAPSLYDRIRRGIELGYSPADIEEGRGYRLQITHTQLLATLAASIAVVKHAGRVGAVGYCWGGTCAYIAACELPVACAVSYYGGQITQHLGKSPKKPMQYHFGELDQHIPASDIDKIRAANPTGIFYTYPAGHGFNCTERSDYHPASAALALRRTLEFFTEYVG